jgi:hypothetical protein
MGEGNKLDGGVAAWDRKTGKRDGRRRHDWSRLSLTVTFSRNKRRASFDSSLDCTQADYTGVLMRSTATVKLSCDGPPFMAFHETLKFLENTRNRSHVL